MSNALQVIVGRGAARHLANSGWQGRDVSLLLGASGGPKWLILGHLDRLLFGSYLMQDRQEPLQAIGSSVGTWRHACLAQDNPIKALDRFEDIYVNWDYSDKPDAAEISAVSFSILGHIFGDSGAEALVHHPLLHSYIVTARGRGLNSSTSRLALGVGMGGAGLLNALDRRLLASQFQRVVFASRGATAPLFRDFASTTVALEPETVVRALHASGAIPFVLAGERDLPGGPPGHYWDGGIIDYHFGLDTFRSAPLVLYPHFRADLTPGWFDKFLPWRRYRPPLADNLILLSPSPTFIASLPQSKIPDRSDFMKLSADERKDYWRSCVERSRELAEDFNKLIYGPDPLAGVTVLD